MVSTALVISASLCTSCCCNASLSLSQDSTCSSWKYSYNDNYTYDNSYYTFILSSSWASMSSQSFMWILVCSCCTSDWRFEFSLVASWKPCSKFCKCYTHFEYTATHIILCLITLFLGWVWRALSSCTLFLSQSSLLKVALASSSRRIALRIPGLLAGRLWRHWWISLLTGWSSRNWPHSWSQSFTCSM